MKGYVYTAQNQAWSVWNGASQATATQRTRWFYGPDGGRYKRIDDGSNNTARTVLMLGGVERITTGTVVTWRRPLAGGLVQTFTGATPTTPQHTRTQLHDHIGSIVAIASDTGNLVENADHGAFGNRRGWVGATQLGQLNLTTTDRGFTGHEHAQNLDTIHMNGRIYDPVQARFLQADPLVQDPYNPQNWNPFAYVYNNPLANTDPTGMMSVGQIVRMVAAIAISIFVPAMAIFANHMLLGSLVGGFLSGVVSSGSLKGGLMGAFSAGMFYGIGSTFAGVEAGALTAGQAGAKMLMHGMAGGIMSELQGGKFGHGFASAAVTQAFASKIDGIDGGARFSAKRIIASAALGGTTSVISGGKFGNGAMTGAFSRAFNDEGVHHATRRGTLKIATKGAPEDFRSDAESMLGYIEAGGSSLVDDILRQDVDISIQYKKNTFQMNFGEARGRRTAIIWVDPASGLRLDSGIQSPAIGLYHELAHAYRATMGLGEVENGEYSDAEEDYVTGLERNFAAGLYEPTRMKHSEGELKKVESPTCGFGGC